MAASLSDGFRTLPGARQSTFVPLTLQTRPGRMLAEPPLTSKTRLFFRVHQAIILSRAPSFA